MSKRKRARGLTEVACWNKQKAGEPTRFVANYRGVDDGIAICVACGEEISLDADDVPAHEIKKAAKI